MKEDILKMRSATNGLRSLSFNNGSKSPSEDSHSMVSIPHNSCFLVNGKERKLSNSYLRFQRRYSKHGTRDATYDYKDGSVHMHLRGKPVTLYAPTELKNSYSLYETNPTSPDKSLKLEWVYGYRGKDARSNLYLLPTGELVYFMASVVVLFNPDLNKQRHYMGHTEEVKCLAVHPNKLLIATGQATSGQDRRENKPHVRIWNSASLQTQCIIGIGNFERSVVCLSFAKDGSNHLVAVDEGSDHTMTVWEYQGNQANKISEAKCSNKETVIAAEFHPLDSGVIVTCGKGHVNFWQLENNGNLSRKTGVFDANKEKPKYVTCLAFGSNGDVLTGDSNGNVFVWRRGYNAVTKSLKKVHNGPIFAICVLKDGGIVSGGGKDGKLIHFDENYKKTNLECELPEEYGSIRTICQGRSSDQLIVGTTDNCLVAGTFLSGMEGILSHGHDDEVLKLVALNESQFLSLSQDKWIRIWELNAHQVIWSYKTDDVSYACCISNDGSLLLVGFQDGCWIIVDIESKCIIDEFTDLTDCITDMQFSPNGCILAVVTKAGVIHLYQVTNDGRKYNRIGRCVEDGKKQRSSSTGSPVNFVTQSHCGIAIDWSDDSSFIRANSSDASISFWNATTCRSVNNHAAMRDVDWVTQNCLVSFDTIGVWPETIDGTDLTMGCKSASGKYFASGDDFGKLKLYNHPVNKPKAQPHVYAGHSAPISSVTFSTESSHLFSAGGKDTAILQWKIV